MADVERGRDEVHMKFGWKTRIGLVLSAVWFCLVLLGSDDYQRTSQVLGVGLLPLVIIWGIAWAVSGWRAQRSTQPQIPESVRTEAKRKRGNLIRTILAFAAVLCLGLFAASWQLHVNGVESGDVPRWLGEWSVYGLIIYVIFRFIPKLPFGSPAVLAALVVVSAVNYKAHALVVEEPEALASLTLATPLIAKMQAGASVSDEEVKGARMGVLEPLLLAQAAYSRDIAQISASYQKAVADLAPEQMLAPTSLVSPNTRFQIRSRLKVWEQVSAEYTAQVRAATARARLGVQAALVQMPAAYSRSAGAGFDQSAEQLLAYVDSHASMEKEAAEAIAAILSLLDASPNGFVLDKGPPANLLFRDELDLAAYRRHFGIVLNVGKRESEAQAEFLKTQISRTKGIEDLLKGRRPVD